MSSIDDYIILYDYNDIGDFQLSEDLKSVMKFFSEIKYEESDVIKLPTISKVKLWTDSKAFMESKFRLHNVGYLNDKKLSKLLNKSAVCSLDDVASIFNGHINYRSPYFLPIEFSHNNILGGSLVCQSIIPENDKEFKRLQELLKPCFSRVILPKKTTSISPISYSHEITHSQVLSHKGSVEDFHNTEVLSIYIELLHAYQADSRCFRLDLLNRMEHALGNFYSLFIYKNGDRSILGDKYDDLKFHIDAQYLQSILVAINLMSKTLYGTEKDRKFIFGELQKVFDGKITVEQFMEKTNCTYEESLDYKYTEKLLKKVK